MASIEELKGLVSSKGGVARTNVFAVELPSLPGATSREVNILCRDVNLPGRQITTYDRQIGMKATKTAYGYLQDDVSMTFMLMNDYGIKRYFETWMAMAINYDTKTVRYKNQYAMPQVKIRQMKKGTALPIYSTSLGIPKLPAELQNRLPKIGPFDLAEGEFDFDIGGKDSVVYECVLKNVFPTTMNAINLNNEPGGIAELNVQLSYDDWTSSFTDGSQNNNAQQLGTALLGGLAARFLN